MNLPMTFLPARRRWLATLLAALAVTVSLSGWGQSLPTTPPDQVGLSGERLQRLGDWLRSEVQQKRIPGAVILVARGGKVAYFESVGQLDPAKTQAMTKDAIFRIYSMSKPLTTVAAMMLVEEGKLLLEAPLSRYIPAYAQMKVGIEKVDPATGAKTLELVPARRPITIQDLMRHTSGLTYGFFGDSLVKKAYNDAGMLAGEDLSNAEFAERLATMPLHYQPGSTWDYSYSTDVLGRVVEIVSGQSLYQFMKVRLLDPLGMRDTSFYVPEEARRDRVAEPLADDRVIGVGVVMNDPRLVKKAEPGGQGMVSTANDYARFLQMLLNGGELDGRRYLSPKTIEYMTADQLGTGVATTPLYLPGPGYGFGLGFAVRKTTGEAPFITPAGDYWWGGAGGTYFWVDPKTNLYAILMVQSPKQRGVYRSIMRNMVYAAVVK
jgi:CubicO group peptidase (beta-lactamase class C family)